MNVLIIHEITSTVAKYTGVPVKSMCSPSRRRGVVRARWVAMYMVRKKTHATLEEIGFLFRRNHSSVLYGINIVEKERCLIDCARCVQEEILKMRLAQGIDALEGDDVKSMDLLTGVVGSEGSKSCKELSSALRLLADQMEARIGSCQHMWE